MDSHWAIRPDQVLSSERVLQSSFMKLSVPFHVFQELSVACVSALFFLLMLLFSLSFLAVDFSTSRLKLK